MVPFTRYRSISVRSGSVLQDAPLWSVFEALGKPSSPQTSLKQTAYESRRFILDIKLRYPPLGKAVGETKSKLCLYSVLKPMHKSLPYDTSSTALLIFQGWQNHLSAALRFTKFIRCTSVWVSYIAVASPCTLLSPDEWSVSVPHIRTGSNLNSVSQPIQIISNNIQRYTQSQRS